MEPITLTALAVFLAPYFTKAGETLAVETVKLALENRKEIKNKFLNLFQRDEIISLGLNEQQSPEEVKALITDKPEVEEEVRKTLEANKDLLDELAEVLSKQEGRTIHAKYYFENVNTIYFDERDL